MIEEVANSDLPGLIFTYVWALVRAEHRRDNTDLPADEVAGQIVEAFGPDPVSR